MKEFLQKAALKLTFPAGKIISVPALVCLAFAGVFWFAALYAVDPLHHVLYRRPDFFLPLLCAFLSASAGLLLAMFKWKVRIPPAGLLCAAGAVICTLFPTFTALAVGLTFFSSAVWLCFDGKSAEFREYKVFILVPVLLSAFVFASGFEQQLNAYNRMVFLYEDWGIYFTGYKRLGEAPLAPLGQWICIGNHFNPSVNLLMAGIVKLFPRAETIFGVNSFLLASIVPLVFILGRLLKLPRALCAVLAAAAAFNPMFSNQHTALIYGYHPIVFLPAAFLLFAIALVKKCRWGMILAGLFICGIKETVFIFAAGAAFLLPPKWKWYWRGAFILLCGALFAGVTFVVLPRCDSYGSYFQLFHYNSLGKDLGELVLSPFLAPGRFWGKLFREGNISFLLLLLLPFLPGAWKAPRLLLAALPVALGVLLKDCFQDKHNIVQQYGVEMSVWFMAAMVFGTQKAFAAGRVSCGFIAALLAGSLAGFYFVGKTPVLGTYSASAVRRSPDVRIIREEIKKVIPPGASVALSSKWRSQLADSGRKVHFELKNPETEYLVLDFSDSSADMNEMMTLRDGLLTGRRGHPVKFMNLRGCQAVVFKRGSGPWPLPFIIAGTPEKLLPRSYELLPRDTGIRARALWLRERGRILIFAAVEKEFKKDVALDITAFAGAEKRNWKIRWGYGMFPAYMMGSERSFVIELVLPAHWNGVEKLDVRAAVFEKTPSLQ